MKKIEAMVRPARVDEVKEALHRIGVQGMTVIEAKGFGRQKGHSELYRGTEYTVDFVPKAKIEVVVSEAQLEDAVRAILESAKTGKIGDGKVFVSDIETAYRIRTGESGNEAL